MKPTCGSGEHGEKKSGWLDNGGWGKYYMTKNDLKWDGEMYKEWYLMIFGCFRSLMVVKDCLRSRICSGSHFVRLTA